MSQFVYRRQVEKELLRGRGVLALLAGLAEAGAHGARQVAPFETGEYRDSIQPVVGVDAAGPFGRVLSDDWKAHMIELGSKNNPPFAPLRRGVESTGLRITDPGRRG